MGKVYAVVLAAGSGRRMGGEVAKQYQLLGGKPVICHALSAFEQSVADEVVLVVSAGMEAYARREIVEPYGLRKVRAIIVGGGRRCDSVYAGMCEIGRALGGACQADNAGWGEHLGSPVADEGDIVLVHDGARPFVTPDLIARMADAAGRNACAVPAVPVKDTIKLVKNGFVAETPERSMLYAVQTPQAFCFPVLWKAFEKYYGCSGQGVEMTDDAMLVESMLGVKAAVETGDYKNMKLTTPEDMVLAHAFLGQGQEK
ncbi:MAG: 2-C-methyl-D-erythritol 4-phosphate cytidylyltransferase [Lachnospiraceae bacterium]|nr:2-C-methyl-D-erythritol 4-phosphate cytidylyltransferase [Lachnospiraceae bacterium]